MPCYIFTTLLKHFHQYYISLWVLQSTLLTTKATVVLGTHFTATLKQLKPFVHSIQPMEESYKVFFTSRTQNEMQHMPLLLQRRQTCLSILLPVAYSYRVHTRAGLDLRAVFPHIAKTVAYLWQLLLHSPSNLAGLDSLLMQTSGDTLILMELCWFCLLKTYFLWLHIAQWLLFFILSSYKMLFAVVHFYHNMQVGNQSSEAHIQSPPPSTQPLKRPFKHAILIICCAIILEKCNIFWQITGSPEELTVSE